MHHRSSPQTPSLTLALHHAMQNDDVELDFFTAEPLSVHHPDTPAFYVENGGNGDGLMPLLLESADCSDNSRSTVRRSPRLVAESAGVTVRKGLVQLPGLVGSEKKACELMRVCLEEIDLRVRCLRSGKVVVGSGTSDGKRKRGDLKGLEVCKRRIVTVGDSDGGSVSKAVGLLGFKDNVGGSEGKRVLKSREKSTVKENVRKVGGNVEKSVGERRLRSSPRLSRESSVGGNGVEERLMICGPDLSVVEDSRKNEGGRGLRCSPRLSKVGSVGKNGVEERLLICGSNITRVENSRKNEGERELRCSPRVSKVGSAGKNGVEGSLLKCGPNLTRVGNSRKNEGGNQLRRSPRSSMAGNLGRSAGESLFENIAMSEDFSKLGEDGGESLLEGLAMTEDFSKLVEEKLMQCSSRSSMVKGNVEDIDEEKVLRRSPRALPSSLMLPDDAYDDGIKKLVKKKKKINKIESNNKVAVLSPIEKEKRHARSKCFFVGEPVPEEEAQQRWQWRYELKNRRIKRRSLTGNANEEDEPILNVKCHYVQAKINDRIFNLGDCALIRGDGRQKHIGRIIEFLRTMEEDNYFRVQWFYKAEDTVLKEQASFHDKKRIFYSTIENDNMLDCIISKLNVTQVTPELNIESRSLPSSDYYYDMEYSLDYSTFRNLPTNNCAKSYELPSISSQDPVLSVTSSPMLENASTCESYSLLDLYAGCGAMSTGLCFGARHSGVNLVTRWAVELDSSACESLRVNHSETQVRNEAAEDFLELLKHWEKLCKRFVTEDVERQFPPAEKLPDSPENNADAHSESDDSSEELEVSSLVDICYGKADKSGKHELKFKVHWKGYGPDDDTWEPIEGLSNCQELIQDFVVNGFKRKILPLPGDVDVLCGGPPCQGISGYNRFRCVDDPLADERNQQLIVFMDIVDYLKPKFVLMENVSDILRFDKGSLGRYALSRLVHMHYQARVGMMAAGCYGIPQFRLRVFFWGALPTEELPQYPLPTHDVVVKYWPPAEFERNLVGYEEGCQPPELETAVLLGDAISDLPVVTNFESQDAMPYSRPPETNFQKYIRSFNYGMIGYESEAKEPVLYDHRPLQLFEDDYVRVCRIPRKKGANFRDLPGLVVGDDKVVRRDPSVKIILLPSGKPLVPEYAFTFEQGKSKRPFARLWWDETMATIITVPNCHSQALLHPEQDRMLTIRECARLQGFPDSYRLCGTVKHRYRQVGNAVAIPVAKALGYALGLASQKRIGKESLLTLPLNFAYSN